MKNDLSKLKAGDWVWTIQNGWERITDIEAPNGLISFPIETETNKYTEDGKLFQSDARPSMFLTPPEGFNAGPKPRKIKKWMWCCLTAGGFHLITEHMAEPPDASVEAIKLPWSQIEEKVKDE